MVTDRYWDYQTICYILITIVVAKVRYNMVYPDSDSEISSEPGSLERDSGGLGANFFVRNREHLGGGVTGVLAVCSFAAGAVMLINHFCSMVDEGNLPGEIIGYFLLVVGFVLTLMTVASEIFRHCRKDSDDTMTPALREIRVDPALDAMSVNEEGRRLLQPGNGFPSII